MWPTSRNEKRYTACADPPPTGSPTPTSRFSRGSRVTLKVTLCHERSVNLASQWVAPVMSLMCESDRPTFSKALALNGCRGVGGNGGSDPAGGSGGGGSMDNLS